MVRTLTVMIGCAIVAIAAGIATSKWIASESGYAFLREPTQTISPSKSRPTVCEFQFVNPTLKAIRILGAKSTCHCLALRNAPLVVQPGDTAILRYAVDVSEDDNIEVRSELLLDIANPPVVATIRVSGRKRQDSQP